MECPDRWSQPSKAGRQRRGLHDKSVDSASHGYVNDFGRDQQLPYDADHLSPWLRSVDDPYSQDSSFTGSVDREPLRHSTKKHRKDKSRDDRSRALEDLADGSGYDEQRSCRKKARQGRGSLANDPDRPTARLGRGSLADDSERKTAHREHIRPRHYEPKQYDSDDSFTWTDNNKSKSNEHETNSGSYPSSGYYRKGHSGGTRQQDYGYEGVRPRIGSSRLDAFDRPDPFEPWPVRYPSYSPLDDDRFVSYQVADRILEDSTFSRRAGHHEPGPQYPPPDIDNGTFSDENRYARRSNFAHHGFRNRDESDYVPLRRLEGSDRHHRLLEAPSDKGGRRGFY